MKQLRKSTDFSINEKISENRGQLSAANPSEDDALAGNTDNDALVQFNKNTLTWTTPSKQGFVCGIFMAPAEGE